MNASLLASKTEGPCEEIWGSYLMGHPRIKDHVFFIRVSDGVGWDHVSVSIRKKHKRSYVNVERCPTWDEMCWIKERFFGPEEVALQYHPAESEYVNLHKYVLHLWRPQNHEIPVPLSIQV